MKKLSILFILSILITISCGKKESGDILVFSKTEGFRHESIGEGIKSIIALGEKHEKNVVATEDASYFTEDNLKNFKVVVFLNTTGDCLDNNQQYEFQRFIQAGGGYVGIHAAADTEYDWPWYGKLVGAYFESHPMNPNVNEGSIDVIDKTHISCSHLPDRWERTDEWYNYKDINGDITVLMNLDESTYEGGTNGDSHPIAWYHEYDGGRAFYTGGGHTDESFQDENFMQHIWGGIQYTMGDEAPIDYTKDNVAPATNRFQKVVYADYLNEPMELELLPDGRILFIERDGSIKLHDIDEATTKVLTTMEVWSELEDGLIGMALDPEYANNNRIYLYYSPVDEVANILSRFELFPDDTANPLRNEIELLKVKTQRDECCHAGGSIEFGPDGNLFLSTGDNTNPHKSNGHSPSDFTSGRSPFDAQKSSANTNDLRGKILRITPQEDGSYSIPEGNLFAEASEGRSEIYIMGCRNPYRISIDQRNGNLYWGEVGPDANKDTEKYGPRGYDEVNQAKEAGFFGWPLFIADNKAYRQRDFATDTTTDFYDANAPVNNSPNNTGAKELPPAQKAMIYYPYGESEEFPLLGTGGRNAMAGPVFYADDYPDSDYRYPTYYDGKFFAYDWMRGWIMAVTFDEEGNYSSMEQFLPHLEWANLIDVVMSPEGDMYTLEYGKGWFSKNPDATLSRIKFNKGNRAPVSRFDVDGKAGAIPFTIALDGASAQDPDGDELAYTWDFGNGDTAEGKNIEYTYQEAGAYEAKLTVTDKDGMVSESMTKIYAGNAPPEVSWKLNGGNESFYWPGSKIDYEVSIADKEDGSIGKGINAEDVTVTIDFLKQGFDQVEIAMGHQALSELNLGHAGLQLIKKSDCMACHKEYGVSVGPSYEKIAKKYAGDEKAVAYLAEKIIQGGGGVWGEVAMAAHPNLGIEKAESMAEYILSIEETTADPEKSMPVTGAYVFDKSPEEYPEGSYILTASYVDKGADGAERLLHKEIKVLRPPIIPAVSATSMEKATAFKVTKDMVPDLEKEFEIVMMNGGAEVIYDNIDLTGVAAVEVGYNAISPFMAGGDLELHLDEKGTAIGSIELTTSSEKGSTQSGTINFGNVDGRHKLIFLAKGGMLRPTGAMISLRFIPKQTI